MRKLTDFMIDKRYPILIVFLFLTIVFAFLSNQVNINYDMAKYLPDHSQTRIGMNIMEQEFSKKQTSTLNIMFENLKDKEKIKIQKELESISYVEDVAYENTSHYNQGKYTLFVLTVQGKSDGEPAKKVYQEIHEKYKDKSFYTSGEISETNKSVLPFWILALAVFCALLILLIMCESYVEPFLFLATILMAVVLNKGTNIIFPSVSHITDSIVAILQMALSMDYSIMLMNRYDQEKRRESDKIKAMKNALHKAFQSISSSSVTTIVGLLALVFMSFKIGKDLGLILAKGVLFSLICIFFVLPSLILLFDSWIVKTKKKKPSIHLEKLGKISDRFKGIAFPIFLLLFLISFLLKGNLAIAYTDQQEDQISKVFKEKNQIAILYPNQEEGKIAKYLKELEKEKKSGEVLGYGNTIHEKLTYQNLNKRLQELGGQSVPIDEYLLKIIYYDFYNLDENDQITLNEFIKFIEQEVYQNPFVQQKISTTIKEDITRLKNFISEEEIHRKRTPTEIASILEIEENSFQDLFILYLSLHSNQKMSLDEFVTFMNQEVLQNKKYENQLDQKSKEKLLLLNKLTQEEFLSTPMKASSLASILEIEESKVTACYQYFLLKNNWNYLMTFSDFFHFVINDLGKDPHYADLFDLSTLSKLEQLSNFSDLNQINKKMNSQELASFFGMKEDLVKQLLFLQASTKETQLTYTLQDFINQVIQLNETTSYLEDLDLTPFYTLKENKELEKDTKAYTSSEMASFLNQEVEEVDKLYHLIDFFQNTSLITETPLEFNTFLLENAEREEIQENLSSKTIESLKLLKVIMEKSLENNLLDAKEIARLLGLDEDLVQKIYLLSFTSQNEVSLTPKELIEFLNQKDPFLESQFSKEEQSELQFLQNMIESVLAKKTYTKEELASFLTIDQEHMDLLFGLHKFYSSQDTMLSFDEFFSFLLENVLSNSKYENQISSSKVQKLNTVHTLMKNSSPPVRYTSKELFGLLASLSNEVEENTIQMLYTYYGSCKAYQNTWKMTVEEFVDDVVEKIEKDDKFKGLIEEKMKRKILDAKEMVLDAKNLLVGKKYSRIVLNTELNLEGKETFQWIQKIQKQLKENLDESYVIGDSPMAYEMSKTFQEELQCITILTMVAIFIVVAITFKSIIIPILLVLTIQCAVYLTMGILTITGENVYFISILIVQSILMGATIDYAILYTSYYLEYRKKLNIRNSLIEAYNQSISTILTSSSILIIVTLIIACFASLIASKICKTISQGTLCSTLLILFLLPSLLAFFDRWISKNKDQKEK